MDLADRQWEVLEPLIGKMTRRGRCLEWSTMRREAKRLRERLAPALTALQEDPGRMRR